MADKMIPVPEGFMDRMMERAEAVWKGWMDQYHADLDKLMEEKAEELKQPGSQALVFEIVDAYASAAASMLDQLEKYNAKFGRKFQTIRLTPDPRAGSN